MGYSYTWTGDAGTTSWTDIGNWAANPSDGASYPGTGSNDAVDIPGSLSSYPDIQTGQSFNIFSLTVETNATLAIEAAGYLTVTGTASLQGQIDLNGGNLTAAGLTFNSGLLDGFGAVGGPINGTGTIKADGGLLVLTGYVDSTGSPTTIVVEDGSTAFLSSGTGVGSSSVAVNLTFDGTDHAVFKATNAAMNTVHIAPIAGFSGTDSIVLKASSSAATNDKLVRDAGANSVTITDSPGNALQTFYFAAGTDIDNIKLNVVDKAGIDALTICFMPGTMIRTPEGEAAVETLRRGDPVLTAGGEVKPVVWVGRQTVVSRFADPVRNWPIRIAAGALAENVPSRDLLVSPEHALLVEDLLVNANALVNGTSIRRESAVPESFVYYHVELEDHALVLAENVPAETFVDNVDRRYFDNWAEHDALYPDGRAVAELPQPRVKAQRQLPVEIRQALAARAAALGLSEAA